MESVNMSADCIDGMKVLDSCRSGSHDFGGSRLRATENLSSLRSVNEPGRVARAAPSHLSFSSRYRLGCLGRILRRHGSMYALKADLLVLFLGLDQRGVRDYLDRIATYLH